MRGRIRQHSRLKVGFRCGPAGRALYARHGQEPTSDDSTHLELLIILKAEDLCRRAKSDARCVKMRQVSRALLNKCSNEVCLLDLAYMVRFMASFFLLLVKKKPINSVCGIGIGFRVKCRGHRLLASACSRVDPSIFCHWASDSAGGRWVLPSA